MGAIVAALLILASVGAAYWLNADAHLPPVPLSPSLLSTPPERPRSWELLDPAGLAVESRPDAPAAEHASADPHVPAVQAPDAGAQHRPVQ